MLKHLYIKDFVLFDECDIDFYDGFSALTGETGAGKSIMIDAISLLCADRASGSLVAHGKDKALIEGVFAFKKGSEALDMLEESGFETDEDIIVTRTIRADGKSEVRINHRVVNLSLLKKVLENQIDIHSQHDTQYLLNNKTHLRLLDEYVQNNELTNEVKQLYKAYKQAKDDYDELVASRYNENELEFLHYEVNEIEEAQLSIGEEEELIEKDKKAQALFKNMEKMHSCIDVYDDQLSDALNIMMQSFDSLKGEYFDDMSEAMHDHMAGIEDIVERLRDTLNDQEFSEEEINQIQERLFVINRLKRKYGPTVEMVLKHLEESKEAISRIEHRAEHLAALEKEISVREKAFMVKAEELSSLRKEKALKLDEEIKVHLNDLVLPNAQFRTIFSEGKPSSSGIDNVEFMISMNMGEPLRPLVKVASGGELARLMLGLKIIFTSLQGIETVIFDEIDSGVSGPVATSIGRKMAVLGRNVQVFSITHLAQVAAHASHHYHVSKHDENGRTTTNVRELGEDEVITQLALIASGTTSEAALSAARELYEGARR